MKVAKIAATMYGIARSDFPSDLYSNLSKRGNERRRILEIDYVNGRIQYHKVLNHQDRRLRGTASGKAKIITIVQHTRGHSQVI